MERILTQAEAIREALEQEMALDSSVVCFGLDVDDHKALYGTTRGLPERFGPGRCFGTPLSEDAMTGVAVGMALAGLRPVHVHIRMDFLLLAMNQLVNIAAKSRYMFGGQVSVPIVVRSIIGRSWGQGAQHSQGLHGMFMHVPGLKVVAPTTPYDAKGCLIQAIRDNDPVMYVEHRMLHFQKGHVPEEPYALPLGRARVLRPGEDVTLVGISYMAVECLRAARHLEQVGLSAEVIDPVTLSPLDMETILSSVRKTGRLLVVDNSWTFAGASGEIAAQAHERLQDERPPRVARMGYAPAPCPTAKNLENLYYPTGETVAARAYTLVTGREDWSPEAAGAPEIVEFKGPF